MIEVYEDLDKRNVVLSFKGNITDELLTSILHVIEQKLERYNEPKQIKRKVFNVLVECLQNLYLHSNDEEVVEEEKSSVMVMVAKLDDGYNILTGNVIPKENVETLSKRLVNINQLSHTELKELYIETLTDGKRSAKGGGGLGFLEIARKSKRKLEFGFVPFDDKSSFFSLNVKITQ